MASVIVPEGPLCAGQYYDLTVDDAAGIELIQWVVMPTGLPPGITPADVIFTNPQGLSTKVVVPIAGTYTFAVKTCERA